MTFLTNLRCLLGTEIIIIRISSTGGPRLLFCNTGMEKKFWFLDYSDFNYLGTFFGQGHPNNRGPTVCKKLLGMLLTSALIEKFNLC